MPDGMNDTEKVKETTTTQETNLLDDIIQVTKLKPADETYSMTKQALQEYINKLVKRPGERVSQALVDEMIADLDRKLSQQVDAIIHHADFQKLESSWRGLQYLVRETNFRENIRIDVLNVKKEELIDDFEDAPEIPKSALYRKVYSEGYGQFGGKPYGLMVGDFSFDYGNQDIELLKKLGSVACMSHAPFITGVSPRMFGVDQFSELPNLKDLKSIFEMPQYTNWRGFRDSEDARYVGLVAPRFLSRLPYSPETAPAKSFTYREDVSDGDGRFSWSNAAYAMASCITKSFAKYRFCANIIGPKGGGAVEDMELYEYEDMGTTKIKNPAEVTITDRREFELAEEGFISLVYRQDSDNAAFFSANSVQKPKFYGISKEGKEAETNYKLGTRLPYMFVMSRLAHYLKVLQRENIGTWTSRTKMEDELNKWVTQFVNDTDTPSEGTTSRRPLRKAQVIVSDVEGDPGWYKVSLKVVPHFKYEGAFFELSLVGKLDKE